LLIQYLNSYLKNYLLKIKTDSEGQVENIYDTNINLEDIAEAIDESEEIAKKWIEDVIKQKVIKLIVWSEFKDHIKIGSGNFGSVFKAYWPNIHNYVAYKKLLISSNIQSNMWEAFKHEIQIQSRVDICENIIRVLGISKSKF